MNTSPTVFKPSQTSNTSTKSPETPSTPTHASSRIYNIVTPQTRSAIRSLCVYSDWTFECLHHEFKIPFGTLHQIIHAPRTPEKNAFLKQGRKPTLTTSIKKLLIDTATSCAKNQCMPLTDIAKLVGVWALAACLRRTFETEGYHR